MSLMLPLSIDTNYLPDWGVHEGLRELTQNWMDAADALGTAGVIRHEDEGCIVLHNPGADLPRSALLIGHTTKADDDASRGQFGEGLKLGTLALVRQGSVVIIRTGTEEWTASMSEHPAFPGQQVLTFSITEDHEDNGGVTVTVGGIDLSDYMQLRDNFRALSGVEEAFRDDWHGSLLFGQPGRVYVKGIYVQDVAGLRWGYDLARVKVDRDRRLVNGFDFGWHASAIVAGAWADGVVTVDEVYRTATSGKGDLAHINSAASKEQKEALAACFISQHGEKAIPCWSEDQRRRLNGLGVVGVILPDGLRECVESVTGTADDAIKRESAGPARRFTDDDLTAGEIAAKQWAVEQIHAVTGHRLSPAIVEFRKSNTIAAYSPIHGVQIARKALACPYQTLGCLVHELSHAAELGKAHGPEHGAMMEHLWERLAAHWHGAALVDLNAPDADQRGEEVAA